MSYATCDHLKEDGVYCQSPALQGHNFCHFHLDMRARRLQMVRARRRGETCRLQLPVLDHTHAVLAALQQVGDALVDDRIDPKRAGLMLYMLQQTATALNTTPEWKGEREQLGHAEPMRALEVSDVAQQYDLPKGVDLNLPPEAALDALDQPADPSEKPKEHVRLARAPERKESRADQYYRIPKKLSREKTEDEYLYEDARALFDARQAIADDSDDIKVTADVA